MLADVYGSAAPFKSRLTGMPTPENVETAISELYNREEAFADAVQDDAIAEHAYKVDKAKAFLRATGTEKAREAQSIVDTENLYLDHLKKKAIKEFTREKLRDAQDALSARQSLLKYETQTSFGMTATGS